MPRKVWLPGEWSGGLTWKVIVGLMRLRILDADGRWMRLLLPVEFIPKLVTCGIHWLCTSIGFFIAVAGVAVNHELGTGTAPDPVVWSVGAPAKKPRLQEAACEYAAPPGPDSLGCWGWVRMSGFSLTQDDSDAWPYLALLGWAAG